MNRIYSIKGEVKHYDWGGYSFIPRLLDIENKSKQPFAEYWMSQKNLPYLLKVLDVRNMLSIQVHPTKAAAEKEFERENKEGIRIDAPNRNYRDRNHKPELMVALSDFWLLHGFKPLEELVYTLLNVVELRELLPIFNQSGYKGLYHHVMEMPQEDVNRLLRPLVNNFQAINNESNDEIDEDYWAAKAAKTFGLGENLDRGIISIYLFNLVHLKKGDGIFQAAGVPHAYLQGQNVEIMANSDNVLRGGLTTKHIDVKELLKHVKCEATYPDILSGEENEHGEIVYPVKVPDFHLSAVRLKKDQSISRFSTVDEIWLAIEGSVQMVVANETTTLIHGSPGGFVKQDTEFSVTALTDSYLFRAS